MDAVGVLMVSAGMFLVYSAYKGQHPWTVFTQTITATAPKTIT